MLSPVIGLAAYMIYLWQTTGDALFFFTSQPAFGANRSSHLILLPQVLYRYMKIFFTASVNFQYAVSLFEVVVFTFAFAVICFDVLKVITRERHAPYRLPLIGLHVYSLVSIIIPSMTGTLSSLPRYSLLAISLFIALARINNTVAKTAILILFYLFHVVMLAFFVQGYFVS